MRIIAGVWRGRVLATPHGMATRPTSDRAREGLFSMLTSRFGSFEGLRVADLFAGSGALGLEALSRGAAHCLFIDNAREAIDAIRKNVETLGADTRATLRQQAAEHAMPPEQPCDLILIDPPYAAGLGEQVLCKIVVPGWLHPGAWVSVETEAPEIDLPEGLTQDAHRRFGRAHLHLLRRSD